MLNHQLLKLGAPKHNITDHKLCNIEIEADATVLEHVAHHHEHNATFAHNHGAVEAELQRKYGGAQIPLHGLVGQTWRNVLVCGKHWTGGVHDYVASSLFASDYFFNFFVAK